MTSNDPYEILGVSKNATPDEINAAYKKKAKSSHPDQGGSAEKFTRIKQASMVLLDPKKRKRFDEDGFAEDDKPDNLTSTAMQRVVNFFINTINASMDGRGVDLNQLDLVAGANLFFDQEISSIKNNIANVKKQITQFEKAAKRIKSKRKNDMIKVMLNHHCQGLRKVVDANEQEVAVLSLAKDVLKDYSFEQEQDTYTYTLIRGFYR